MPRMNTRDHQEFHDEVARDGRRPARISSPAAWDDRTKSPRTRRRDGEKSGR